MRTEVQPNSPTTIARLRGLLEVTRLVRSDADVSTVLAETARILRETLGYQTVVINLYRPAWDNKVYVFSTFLERPEEAIQCLDQIIRSYPDSATAYTDRGQQRP